MPQPAGFGFPWFRTFVHPKPLPLIRSGRIIEDNLKEALLSQDELMSQVRQQGVDSAERVRAAALEGDGHVSAIEEEGKPLGDISGWQSRLEALLQRQSQELAELRAAMSSDRTQSRFDK